MATKYTKLMTFLRLGDNCYYCGAPFDGDPSRAKTVDHKQPLSRGGNNRPSNLVACCYICNHTKANMTEYEFKIWRRRGRPNKVEYLKEIGLIPESADR